jgi:hypothetical protein
MVSLFGESVEKLMKSRGKMDALFDHKNRATAELHRW